VYPDDYQPEFVGYGYDPYLNVIDPTPHDNLLGLLPYGAEIDLLSGGLASELIGRALGTGYYQGLLDGQFARELGIGDDYYRDPYALYNGNNPVFDPYSASMGEYRRVFSEGYELGYRDALAGREELGDQFDGDNVDLLSLLIGSALSFRG
jgi:hypothetical protein